NKATRGRFLERSRGPLARTTRLWCPKSRLIILGSRGIKGLMVENSEEKYPPFVYPFDMVFRAFPAQYAQDARLSCIMQTHSGQVLVAFMAFEVKNPR